MDKPGLAARRAALTLLTGVLGEGRLLSDMLPGAVSDLPGEDRARAQRLATETLRWMDRADRLLGPHLRQMPPVPVMTILRMATMELCRDGAAPHGVVDAAVSLTRDAAGAPRMAGLVNAVLRKVAADGPAKWVGLPVPRLPKWLRKPLIAAYGRQTVEAIEAAHAAGAALDLTPKDGDAAGWAARLGGVALPTGSVRLAEAGQLTALPGYADGAWWVQDAAAALPAMVLAARPGEHVLDLCAAPGGKTLQLSAAGAHVTALDNSDQRMKRLRENLTRCGLQAEVVVADALTWSDQGGFDAILLDAPCSATGTIRRHPDLPQARDGSGLDGLTAAQARMLDWAVELLRPGGRLVYCTCSLLPEEGEAQIASLLDRTPSLTPDPAALHVPGVEPAWIGPEGLRTRPDLMADQGGMDGFFVACMNKAG